MKKILLKILIVLLNIIYLFIKLIPTKNKIVMLSRQSNKINKDFKLLKEELEKKYTVIVICKTLEGGIKASLKEKIIYGLHMFKEMYHLATSKVCILDSYSPTVSILKHKKSLTVIQIWHSIGTMKKFGYTALGTKEGSSKDIARIMKMHQNYDVVYCASKAYQEDIAKGFNIDINKIKIFTLPRVDLLTNEDYDLKTKTKILKKYPELKNKKNIIYAPTFRKDETNFNTKINDLVNALDLEKYNLIIKLHPLSKANINNKKVIVDKTFSTFDMLFIADSLISDYSCIIYEAGIRNIPLYFYTYDIEEYLNNRGLALDFKEIPGYNEREAIKLIEDLEKEFNLEYQKKFIKKYVTNTQDCTKKMVEDIEKYMQ